jgi:hypothetical protein
VATSRTWTIGFYTWLLFPNPFDLTGGLLDFRRIYQSVSSFDHININQWVLAVIDSGHELQGQNPLRKNHTRVPETRDKMELEQK